MRIQISDGDTHCAAVLRPLFILSRRWRRVHTRHDVGTPIRLRVEPPQGQFPPMPAPLTPFSGPPELTACNTRSRCLRSIVLIVDTLVPPPTRCFRIPPSQPKSSRSTAHLGYCDIRKLRRIDNQLPSSLSALCLGHGLRQRVLGPAWPQDFERC